MPEFEISSEQRNQILDWIGTRTPARHIIGNSSDGREAFIIEGEPIILYRDNGTEMASIPMVLLEGLKADLYSSGFGEAYSRAVEARNAMVERIYHA